MKAVAVPDIPLVDTPASERYDSHIKYANKIREMYEDPGVLAYLCCAKVRSYRREHSEAEDFYLPGQAYIFDQFKRQEEVEALRRIYGKLYIGISLYSDKEKRVTRLAKKFAEDASVSRPREVDLFAARNLVARDEAEDNTVYGQRLRDAFPLADLFVDIDDVDGAKKVLEKFIEGLFGANDISPTVDEYGMYLAKTASLRSLDLSRQVGAAILSKSGEVITLGCNEVPKAGGGAYWINDDEDARDYKVGNDENERIKRALLADVINRLAEERLLINNDKPEDIVSHVLKESTRKGSLLRDAQVMDLLEFGRVIHAEMSAICDAARLGREIEKTTLYCTTFPCHICAKHIVASGVARVVFIEPYPKSYAQDLCNSIVVQAKTYSGSKVQFAPFIGVSPLRFRDLFERGRRKDKEGKFIKWNMDDQPRLIVKYTVATYLQNETAITRLLDEESGKRGVFLKGEEE